MHCTLRLDRTRLLDLTPRSATQWSASHRGRMTSTGRRTEASPPAPAEVTTSRRRSLSGTGRGGWSRRRKRNQVVGRSYFFLDPQFLLPSPRCLVGAWRRGYRPTVTMKGWLRETLWPERCMGVRTYLISMYTYTY